MREKWKQDKETTAAWRGIWKRKEISLVGLLCIGCLSSPLFSSPLQHGCLSSPPFSSILLLFFSCSCALHRLTLRLHESPLIHLVVLLASLVQICFRFHFRFLALVLFFLAVFLHFNRCIFQFSVSYVVFCLKSCFSTLTHLNFRSYGWNMHLLDENQVLHHTKWAMNFKWCLWMCKAMVSLFFVHFTDWIVLWVFKMFFYDSYFILDHNQVHSSWIFIEHLTISVSNSAPVCFSSFHYTHTYCLRFFMTHYLVQILIWIFPHLTNIQTKNTKKESFKNVEYKKNEKSAKLRKIFTFSGAVVSGILCFTAVLCDLWCF